MTTYRCIYQTTAGAYTTDVTIEDMEGADLKDFSEAIATNVLNADFVTLGEDPKDRIVLVKSHIVAVLIKELEET